MLLRRACWLTLPDDVGALLLLLAGSGPFPRPSATDSERDLLPSARPTVAEGEDVLPLRLLARRVEPARRRLEKVGNVNVGIVLFGRGGS